MPDPIYSTNNPHLLIGAARGSIINGWDAGNATSDARSTTDADVLYGGDGDIFMRSTGADTLNGGTGTDSIYTNGVTDMTSTTISNVENLYRECDHITATAVQFQALATIAPSGLDIASGGVSLTGPGAVDLAAQLGNRSVQLTDSSGNDTIATGGDAGMLIGGVNDFLGGDLGADVLDGGAGIDTTTTPATPLSRPAASPEITIRNIENVIGGAGADTLVGDAGNNWLRGGLGADALDGGAGVDTASYSDKIASVVVTLDGASDAIVTVGGVAEDTIRNIENVIGGAGADTLVGDGLANVLAGGSGNDTLTGSGGFDTFVFRPAFGHDIVTDFSSSDSLRIDPTIFTDFSSLLSSAQQVGTNTVITASSTDTITLQNFNLSNLTASQVQFT